MEPLSNEEFIRIFMPGETIVYGAKARPEQVRQHPSHPEYRRPSNPWTQRLPVEKPPEIKNVAEEIKKQKPNKDYLELFEE